MLRKYFTLAGEFLRSSFWFVPAIMAVLAVVVGWALLQVDRSLQAQEGTFSLAGLFYGGGPEGAREVLSVVAGSMITVAGVVFSVTMVALSLASQQFGPRLLRNFMRDRANQVVLGTFIATFIYCLVVLREVRGDGRDVFVPGLSVAFGVAFALVSIGVLIFFIHHTAISIQANHVVKTVFDELRETLDELYPEKLKDPALADEEWREPPQGADQDTVRSRRAGYLLAFSRKELVEIAAKHGAIIVLEQRPGDFVKSGDPLARIRPAGALDRRALKRLRRVFAFGSQRTSVQDLEFVFNQMAELAIRAISPSLNDPYTAMASVDYLREAFSRLAERRVAGVLRWKDSDGVVRLVGRGDSFAEVMDATLTPLRQFAERSPQVLMRMLELLHEVALRARRPGDRQAIRTHAEMVHRTGMREIREENDLKDLTRRYMRVLRALEDGPDRSAIPAA